MVAGYLPVYRHNPTSKTISAQMPTSFHAKFLTGLVLSFTSHLGNNLHFTSGMNTSIVLIWYQTAQNFRNLFSKAKTRKPLLCILKLVWC